MENAMNHRSQFFAFPFQYGGATDIGLVRKNNQDVFIRRPDIGLFAVIDGMGGLPGGEQAARMVASALTERIEARAANLLSLLPGDDEKLLQKIVQDISDEMHHSLNMLETRYGAALVCAWLIRGCALFANLGDCRGYLLAKDQKDIRQITEDHNAAQELVKKGLLTKTAAINHPSASRLVRFMGMRPPAQADCYAEAVKPGDSILLCSDGLYGQVQEQRISGIMREGRFQHTVCDRLIAAARKGGGCDNITAVYIHIEEGSVPPTTA